MVFDKPVLDTDDDLLSKGNLTATVIRPVTEQRQVTVTATGSNDTLALLLAQMQADRQMSY